MAHGLTPDEYDILRLCVRSDLTRSRLAVLASLKNGMFFLEKGDSMRRTMESLAGKLSAMGDTEFAAMDFSDMPAQK